MVYDSATILKEILAYIQPCLQYLTATINDLTELGA